jgi:tetratricopeptide (TPR) repeat protein
VESFVTFDQRNYYPLKKTNPSAKPVPVELAIDPAQKILKRLIWLIGMVSAFVYVNTIKYGFVLDDLAVIEQNKFVTSGIAGIPKILSTFYWEGYWEANAGLYRPLSLIMFAIEWSISPNNPAIHHFVNVVLFCLTNILLFKLLRKIFSDFPLWIPFIVTLLFAVHPIHTEVVANIKSRDEILCFLLFVSTFLQILKDKKTLKSTLLLAFTFFLCLLSKEAGVLFVPIIGLYFWLIRKDSVKSVLMKVMPLIAISFVWLAIHQTVIHAAKTPPITYTYHDNSLVACEGSSQAATGITILGKYMEKSVLPVNLNYDYSYSEIECSTFSSISVITTILVVIALLFVGFVFRKKNPFLLFGVLFFLIGISLVTNIFFLIGATFAERLLYTPVLGIIILVVMGIYQLLKETQQRVFLNPAALALLVVSVVFIGATVKRNQDWESNQSLFASGVQVKTKSSRIYSNHAIMLMNAETTDSIQKQKLTYEAIDYFDRAIEIDTGNVDAEINVAVCYYRTNQFHKSVQYSKMALAKNPNNTFLYVNLADAYYKLNDKDNAEKNYQKGLSSDAVIAGTFERLGMIYFERKQYDKAIVVFKKGVERFPDFENLKMNVGNCYGIQEKYPEAIDVFEEVYRKNPANKNALNMLIMSCVKSGNTEKAQQYQKLLTS